MRESYPAHRSVYTMEPRRTLFTVSVMRLSAVLSLTMFTKKFPPLSNIPNTMVFLAAPLPLFPFLLPPKVCLIRFELSFQDIICSRQILDYYLPYDIIGSESGLVAAMHLLGSLHR